MADSNLLSGKEAHQAFQAVPAIVFCQTIVVESKLRSLGHELALTFLVKSFTRPGTPFE